MGSPGGDNSQLVRGSQRRGKKGRRQGDAYAATWPLRMSQAYCGYLILLVLLDRIK